MTAKVLLMPARAAIEGRNLERHDTPVEDVLKGMSEEAPRAVAVVGVLPNGDVCVAASQGNAAHVATLLRLALKTIEPHERDDLFDALSIPTEGSP